jgi:TPR repeat protein
MDTLRRLIGYKETVCYHEFSKMPAHLARFFRQSKMLNYESSIEKVCCREFFKISTYSAHFFSPAAKTGDINAQFNLAQMAEFGKGGEMNLVEAVEWYRNGMLS